MSHRPPWPPALRRAPSPRGGHEIHPNGRSGYGVSTRCDESITGRGVLGSPPECRSDGYRHPRRPLSGCPARHGGGVRPEAPCPRGEGATAGARRRGVDGGGRQRGSAAWVGGGARRHDRRRSSPEPGARPRGAGRRYRRAGGMGGRLGDRTGARASGRHRRHGRASGRCAGDAGGRTAPHRRGRAVRDGPATRAVRDGPAADTRGTSRRQVRAEQGGPGARGTGRPRCAATGRPGRAPAAGGRAARVDADPRAEPHRPHRTVVTGPAGPAPVRPRWCCRTAR
jgi:hypothetical protein